MAALRASWPWALALATASTVVTLLAGRLPGVRDAEDATYDLRLTTFSPPPTREKDSVILAVDDATVQGLRSNESYAAGLGQLALRPLALGAGADPSSRRWGPGPWCSTSPWTSRAPTAAGRAPARGHRPAPHPGGARLRGQRPVAERRPAAGGRPAELDREHRAPRARVKSDDPFAPPEGPRRRRRPELVASVLAFPVRPSESAPGPRGGPARSPADDAPPRPAGGPAAWTWCPRSASSTRSRIPTGSCAAPASPTPTGQPLRHPLGGAGRRSPRRRGAGALCRASSQLGSRDPRHRPGRQRRARLRRPAAAALRRPQPPRGVDDSVRREHGEAPTSGPTSSAARWCSSPASRWAPST
jgi:hypothetical protein